MKLRFLFTLLLGLTLCYGLSAQNVFRSGDGWSGEAGWGSNAFFSPSFGASQIFQTQNSGTGNQYFRLGDRAVHSFFRNTLISGGNYSKYG
jgi:hypothetical protein